MYTYKFDSRRKKLIADCKIYPTDIFQSDSPWLYARNNKYENVDHKKVGKWMLFLPKDKVNVVWDKIKMAVANGELWDSKVSTTNTEKTSHVIIIYTKDYTDLNDVIQVLDYLESSEIKPPQVTVYYKTDQQTSAGIYSGGGQRPWIYSSATIREAIVDAT